MSRRDGEQQGPNSAYCLQVLLSLPAHAGDHTSDKSLNNTRCSKSESGTRRVALPEDLLKQISVIYIISFVTQMALTCSLILLSKIFFLVYNFKWHGLAVSHCALNEKNTITFFNETLKCITNVN